MMTFDIQKIIDAAIIAIRDVHVGLQHISPKVGTNPMDIHRREADPKRATAYDVFAEMLTNSKLHAQLKAYDLVIIGEELGEISLTKELNFTGQDKLVALLDMVDGTDLFERHLSNWCSALIFFHPAEQDPEKRILAAFVALPSEDIYCAHRDSPIAQKITLGPDSYTVKPVSGPSSVKSIKEASIAFYGQKIKSFLSVILEDYLEKPQDAKIHPFIFNLAELVRNKMGDETRIYNLGGNPIMMRLIDDSGGAKRIDALFNLSGSAAHDAIPGLYIAQKAGAIVRDLNGVTISGAVLGEKLMKPADKANRVSYVLASSTELADELIRHLTRNSK